MKRLPFFILLFYLLTITAANAQNLFREGYIVKKNGELLNGLNEYQPNQKIPAKCIFKRFDLATRITYSADDIQAFGYRNGNRYESIEKDGKIVFIEVLVKGQLTLYSNGSDYFLMKGKGKLIRLRKENIEYNEKTFENLKSFLEFITEGKCGTISDKFSAGTDLVPLVESFNRYSGEDYHTFNRTYSEKEFISQSGISGANQTRIGVIAGSNIYMLSLDIAPGVAGTGLLFIPDPENETGPVAGLFVEKSLLRKSDKLAVRAELLYTKQDFYCYSEIHQSIFIYRHDAFFDFTAIEIPLLLQYSFTGKRIVPVISTGVAYKQLLSSSYYHIEEKEVAYSNPEISTYEDSNLSFASREISAIAGAGIRFRLAGNMNINIQSRIAYGSGIFLNEPPEGYSTSASYKKFYSQRSLSCGILLGISF